MAFKFGEMKSGNPSLRKAFQNPTAAVGANAMTISGAINKSGILFLLVLAGGYVGWDLPASGNYGLGVGVSLVVGLILSLVIIFRQHMAPALAPVYAIVEGVALGAITAVTEAAYPGIAFNAVCLTLSTLGLMLGLYHFKVIRYSSRFQQVVMFATGAIAITYFVDIMLGMFGHAVPLLHSASPMGIAISFGIVIVAALNLIMDFELINRGAEMGAPKYMEWYSAFALIVTLVWLYLEMLRLLSKLSKR